MKYSLGGIELTNMLGIRQHFSVLDATGEHVIHVRTSISVVQKTIVKSMTGQSRFDMGVHETGHHFWKVFNL